MRFAERPLFKPTDRDSIREVNPAAVVEPRKNVDDLSTNHYGHSLEEDLCIKIIGEKRDWWLADWSEGQAVGIPQLNSDYETVDERYPIYWSAQKLNSKLVPINSEQGEDRSVRCRVQHTPKRWNFWHFSICWQNTQGVLLHRDHPEFSRPMQTAARKLLCDNLLENAPMPRLFATEVYCSSIT